MNYLLTIPADAIEFFLVSDMRSVYGRKKDGGFGERNLKKVLSRFKSQTCGTNEMDMSRGICKKCHMKATFILQK